MHGSICLQPSEYPSGNWFLIQPIGTIKGPCHFPFKKKKKKKKREGENRHHPLYNPIYNQTMNADSMSGHSLLIFVCYVGKFNRAVTCPLPVLVPRIKQNIPFERISIQTGAWWSIQVGYSISTYPLILDCPLRYISWSYAAKRSTITKPSPHIHDRAASLY